MSTATREYSEFAHGPVAAAFSSCIVALPITLAGKIAGMPPWIALVIGTAMSFSMVWAGHQRRPRPLSTASLTYRATAMLVAAGWMFWQLADFPDTAGLGLRVGGTVFALALIPIGLWASRYVDGSWKLAPPIFAGLIATFMIVSFGADLLNWIGSTLTTTDRIACCGVGFSPVLTWLGYAITSLVMLAAPAAVLGVTFANRERTADEELARATRAEQSSTPAAQAASIQRLLCNQFGEWTEVRDPISKQITSRVGHLRVTDYSPWDNGAGESYIVDLRNSKTGVVMSRLAGQKEAIITKMNLPQGCGIEVIEAPGQGRGFVKMDVSRVDTISKKYDYPAIRQRTIMDPLPVGRLRDGSEIGPILRESSVFLWGQKGSGKTVVSWDIIAGALQCTDCLVWVIDLNGGAAAAPFLSAWVAGRVERPCVDWVATEIEEVVHMAEVGLALALDRKKFYRKLKEQMNANLMPIGTGALGAPPPEVLIVIDEGAELGLGGGQMTDAAREARAALDAIMRLARDAAINIVFSGLRATADVADPAFKAGTSVRIGMRVSDSAELAYGFGDYSIKAGDAPYQGSGFICIGHQEPTRVFKSYFLDQLRMKQIGEEVTPWRPYLDARGLEIAGDIYARRWRRVAHSMYDDPPAHVLSYGQLDRGDGGQPNPPAAGTATAVLESPETPKLPSSGSPISDIAAAACAPPPPVGSMEAMFKASAEGRQKEKDARRAQAEGRQPPAGNEPPQGPPPAEPSQDSSVPDSVGDQQEYDRKFAEMAAAFADGLSAGEQAQVDEQIAEIDSKVNSRAVLESLLMHAGTNGLSWTRLHAALCAGGDWGPSVKISQVAMGSLLKRPGSDEPAVFLAPRKKGQPYVHAKYAPPAAETPKDS